MDQGDEGSNHHTVPLGSTGSFEAISHSLSIALLQKVVLRTKWWGGEGILYAALRVYERKIKPVIHSMTDTKGEQQ